MFERPIFFTVTPPMHIVFEDPNATETLKFTGGSAGFISKRDLNFRNNFNFAVKVKATAQGQLANWVSFSENNFIVNPSETKNLTVSIRPPEDAAEGNYTGELIIKFYKAFLI